MKLVVGLGNPGKGYDRTYHNLGFMCIDKLFKDVGGNFVKRGRSLYLKTKLYNEDVVLLKPQTFMNLSGESVSEISKYFKIKTTDIVVFVDDIDLPLGKVRFRKTGSGGTHNGLRNIVSVLKSENFARIKIGTGREEKMDLADFVLSKIAPDKMEEIEKSIKEACNILGEWIGNKYD